MIDLVLLILELISSVPEVQFTLKDEGLEFVWVRGINWVGFVEFGIGC